MTSVVLFVEEPNDVSSVPLTDHVLEMECSDSQTSLSLFTPIRLWQEVYLKCHSKHD